jgi:uncharacterized protein YwgA
MDKLTKVGRLHRLIEAADGRVEGRKKLHKLVYLCQRAGVDLDQSFVFYMYGVYSPSLALDLKTAIEWGVLKEVKDGDTFDILLGDARIDASEKDDREPPLDFTVAKVLSGESAGTLEALSTIVYLYDNGHRGEALRSKLRSLKGHLLPVFPRAFDLAEAQFHLVPEETGLQSVSVPLFAKAL